MGFADCKTTERAAETASRGDDMSIAVVHGTGIIKMSLSLEVFLRKQGINLRQTDAVGGLDLRDEIV